MANFAIYLGAAGLTVSLFVGAVLLALDENPVWPLFFHLGTYLGTWNVIWAVFRACISRITAGLPEDISFMEGATIVVVSYVAAFAVSILIAKMVASWLLNSLVLQPQIV